MSAALTDPGSRKSRLMVRNAWDQVSIYLPIILMGLMALGTYWLARNTPVFGLPEVARPARHDPDYFMRDFSVKTFDAAGKLKSEVIGREARHYPDTDTLEIDDPRILSYNVRGELTLATANRALTNADGSEVQLLGNAVVTREAITTADRPAAAKLQFQGEFLHVFLNTEQVKSHKPVILTRGADRFSADSLTFDNVSRAIELDGRVRGTLVPAGKR